ncbi:MAG TPA: hypothetical protein VMD09_08180 [Solirubrobacteraceae bacterium]|nr:hypothetical protein [Solirubrobacteraceae bacterium]
MRSRIAASAVVLAVLGTLGGVGSIALAAGTQSGGAVKMYGVPKGAGGAFMFTGAIGDYGQTQRENANGTPNANGSYVKFTLKHGTFVANATGFFNALNHAKFSFSKASCSGSFGASGPATLSDGTGSYAGISGTLRVVGTFAEIGPRLKNGKCNMSNKAKPLSQFNVVTGTGHVSFG